jgi:outer membrane protein assembly factor BamB
MKLQTFALTAMAVAGLLTPPALTQEENGQKRAIVTHTGKIVKFERGDPAIVLVKTEKAELNAELAPMTFIEKEKLTLVPEQEITIKGYEMVRDGKSVFVATELTSQGSVVKLRDADFKPLWTETTRTTVQPAIVTTTGTVKTFTRGDPAIAVLQTDKGELVTELAPMTFVEENRLLLAPNEAITLRGYENVRDGKTVFVATEVTMPDRRIVKLRTETREPVWVKTAPATELGEIRDLSGAVTVVDTTDTPDGRTVTIKTDDGPRVIAVAPGTYLTKHRYVLAPGDKVIVRGWDTNRAGRRVFLASELRLGSHVWRFRAPDGRVLWID